MRSDSGNRTYISTTSRITSGEEWKMPKRIGALSNLFTLTRRENPPMLDRLANMFGLSVATFRRRMAQERTSLLTGIDGSGLNFFHR